MIQRSAVLKVLPYQRFDGLEMSLRQILEPSFAVEEGLVDSGEWLDRVSSGRSSP